MTDDDDEAGFRKEALRCRRLAAGVADALTSERLGMLAGEYEQRANLIRLQIRDGLKTKPFIRS